MKTIGASLKLPASNWRPPGRIKKKSREKPLGRNFRLSGLNPGIFRTIIIFVLLMFLSSQIHPINAQPIEGKYISKNCKDFFKYSTFKIEITEN